ncbi:MAG: tyrosine-protein phosphatase [Desulfomonilaceae bacterium]
MKLQIESLWQQSEELFCLTYYRRTVREKGQNHRTHTTDVVHKKYVEPERGLVIHCSSQLVSSSMIDTHNHLLPGLDDGSKDIEETFKMCRMAVDEGIRTIVATPHSFDGKYLNDVNSVKSLVRDLNTELASIGLGVTIMPGMEVRITKDLLQLMADGKVLTLNEGKYVLVEFHPAQIPGGFENLALDLASLGYSVVLGHPEMNSMIQRAPEYLFTLCQQFKPWTFLVQVSADSLTGENGPWAKRTVITLLKHNLAHIIATDAHSSTRRMPRLSGALEVASRIVGRENALKMVRDIPHAVLEEGIFPENWQPMNPRRWWRIF